MQVSHVADCTAADEQIAECSLRDHNVKNEIYLNFIEAILNHLKVSEMKIFIHSDDEEILIYAIALMKMITNR